jgi:hypothetical protein
MRASASAQDAGTEAPPHKPSETADESAQEPEAESAPAPAVVAESPKRPDLSAVRARLSSVLDALIQARTRTSVLTKSLFRTPIELWVVRRADEQRLEHITLHLDGVVVHDSDGSALGTGEARLFEGFATPGLHEIGVEIRESAKTNGEYRYVRSERFRLEIKKGTRTTVQLILRDDSDMAEELPEDDEGEYDVRTRMIVKAEKVEGG